jgi:hypothetical protein
MLEVSLAVRDFIKSKSSMQEDPNHCPPHIYSWVNKELTFTFSYFASVPARNNTVTSLTTYHFHKINLDFIIEFNALITRYWLDVLTRNEGGEIVMKQMKEVFHVFNPPTLLNICKKYFEQNCFVDLKEFVPEMY